ncbi:MAG: glycosyltransferase family 1 protein, partial [Sphingobacteriaceae bacterium]
MSLSETLLTIAPTENSISFSLNLNRNQPRKRWDITLMAFAEVVSRHIEDPIKLLIGTSVQGAWNLLDVYERELSKHGLTLEEGMKHIILIDNPQQLTDEEINILYNACDVGINTADGEGVGCNQLQQGAIGKAQIVPDVGGFKDFLDRDSAIMIEPKLHLYIDNSRDGVGGESQVCHHQDFADAIEYYYTNPEIAEMHGKKCRQNILSNYKWDSIGEKFYGIIKK